MGHAPQLPLAGGPALRLPAELARALRAHAEREYPRECCGILLGAARSGERLVRQAVACRNAHPAPAARYAIAPEELIAAQRSARALGLAFLGFYHSHPEHPAEPSPTDLAQAFWHGCSYLIVAVQGGKAGEMRSFLLLPPGPAAPARFAPEALDIA